MGELNGEKSFQQLSLGGKKEAYTRTTLYIQKLTQDRP